MKKLKMHRLLLGLTQSDIAQSSGIPKWKIAFGETGRCSLSVDEMERIKDVLTRRARRVREVTSELLAA